MRTESCRYLSYRRFIIDYQRIAPKSESYNETYE